MPVTNKQATVLQIAEILLKPTSPSKGPPLPDSWDISWPGFFTRAVRRIQEEPPWVTIRKRGFTEELRREFEVLTGRKII
jgi:hypothetical protein